jgi:tetratricopeptide (TPR) repeat protein
VRVGTGRTLLLGSALVLVSVVLALVAGGAAARPFWTQPQRSPAPRERAAAVREGDSHLREARRLAIDRDGRGIPAVVLDHARAAISAYERALALGPDDAELHFRALVAAQYIDQHRGGMPLCAACRDGYEAVVRHVDGMRRADPRDPRDVEATWEVCIALSKLGGLGGQGADPYFERAVAEYLRWHKMIDEANPIHSHSVAIAYSNAAELLMALGRMEEAIDNYRAAIEAYPTDSLPYYGLAVGYDRDGQWEKARNTMSEALTRDPNIQQLTANGVFFVPEGDLFYYQALAHEVRGDRAAAQTYYERYLVHGKGSRFAARAREHVEELRKGAAPK